MTEQRAYRGKFWKAFLLAPVWASFCALPAFFCFAIWRGYGEAKSASMTQRLLTGTTPPEAELAQVQNEAIASILWTGTVPAWGVLFGLALAVCVIFPAPILWGMLRLERILKIAFMGIGISVGLFPFIVILSLGLSSGDFGLLLSFPTFFLSLGFVVLFFMFWKYVDPIVPEGFTAPEGWAEEKARRMLASNDVDGK